MKRRMTRREKEDEWQAGLFHRRYPDLNKRIEKCIEEIRHTIEIQYGVLNPTFKTGLYDHIVKMCIEKNDVPEKTIYGILTDEI